MHKGRLEAFSDGVLAIIITIMVLELHPPHEATPQALLALAPALLSYILSFIFIGIYWNNHHHTFQVVKHVGGAVLWANLHLLFWLSLIPFVTAWMGESHFARWPVLAYGCVLLACALAYTIMIRALIAVEGRDSLLARAIGADVKGYVSLAIYGLALALCFVHPLLATACFVAVAIIWLIPDRRIEKVLPEKPPHGTA